MGRRRWHVQAAYGQIGESVERGIYISPPVGVPGQTPGWGRRHPGQFGGQPLPMTLPMSVVESSLVSTPPGVGVEGKSQPPV